LTDLLFYWMISYDFGPYFMGPSGSIL